MATLERVGVNFDNSSFAHAEQNPPREVLRKSLKKHFRKSLDILIGNQDPASKLFPAATNERFVEEGHYGHYWVRDGAMNQRALLDPALTQIGENELVEKGREAAVDSIKSNLQMFANNPWKSAFEQEIIIKKDEEGRDFASLTEKAPPIHFQIDGSECEWPTQNQPDSWGSFLISVGQAFKQGELLPSGKDKKVIEMIADFLTRANLTILQQSSMWEWGEVHHPAPTSTLALCAKGLEMISGIVGEKQRSDIEKTIEELGAQARSQYPSEYTVKQDHRSRTDLATMVAINAGALDGVSHSEFFEIADIELGNGEFPGKRRFWGDHYFNHAVEGEMFAREAIWTMGAILEANIFFDRSSEALAFGEIELAEKFKERGLSGIVKVMRLIDHHGFNPELLQNTEKGFVPNGNHLLWNEALMAQASARALLLV